MPSEPLKGKPRREAGALETPRKIRSRLLALRRGVLGRDRTDGDTGQEFRGKRRRIVRGGSTGPVDIGRGRLLGVGERLLDRVGGQIDHVLPSRKLRNR